MFLIKFVLKTFIILAIVAVGFHYVKKLDLDAIAFAIVPMDIYEQGLIDDDFLTQQEILD